MSKLKKSIPSSSLVRHEPFPIGHYLHSQIIFLLRFKATFDIPQEVFS